MDSLLEAGVDLNGSEETRRALYELFASEDARYDGQIYVGVSSTGIYCRPVCTARMPKFENCTFYRTAAQAEAAGFRPCMGCRPETAPGMALVDASENLARRAAAYLHENCACGLSVDEYAERLGYTGRHLRRAFAEEFGVTPVQYLQTCRLLLAKSLLTDTSLPVSQVAEVAGFGSVRRMNHLFKERYRMKPTDLRRKRSARRNSPGELSMRLGYRAPFRFEELLSFFGARAIARIEKVGDGFYARTVRLPDSAGGEACGWVSVRDDPAHSALEIAMSDSLVSVLPTVTSRIRRQFDLDCSPAHVAEGLASMADAVAGTPVPGTRLPGCFDIFETMCRAVLGQQITVRAASMIAARIADAYGMPIETGIEGLDRAWPTPAEMLSLDDPEGALGELGVIKTRTRTILELARLLEEGKLAQGHGMSFAQVLDELLAVKGIGPWTANYIAMRTMGYTDAFLEKDVGVIHALPDMTPGQRLELAESWRPWRSYAVVNLWNSLAE